MTNDTSTPQPTTAGYWVYDSPLMGRVPMTISRDPRTGILRGSYLWHTSTVQALTKTGTWVRALDLDDAVVWMGVDGSRLVQKEEKPSEFRQVSVEAVSDHDDVLSLDDALNLHRLTLAKLRTQTDTLGTEPRPTDEEEDDR